MISQQLFAGERAEFGAENVTYIDCIFEAGESPLKESSNITLTGSSFKWKYPLWYTKHVKATDCSWFDMARAGVWYTDYVEVERSMIEAPKNFRRCDHLKLTDVTFVNALETLWHCKNVEIKNMTAKGDYLAMNCENMVIDNLQLFGNYPFDGCKNIEIHNSKLLSKDAFWNCENVTVYDSYICGEYLAWNSKNVTFVNCTIESLQGLCYIDNLVMKNCKLINTTYAFEYATVDAQIVNTIDSVLNPTAGIIRAQAIKTLIMDKDKIDPEKTTIEAQIQSTLDKAPEVF